MANEIDIKFTYQPPTHDSLILSCMWGIPVLSPDHVIEIESGDPPWFRFYRSIRHARKSQIKTPLCWSFTTSKRNVSILHERVRDEVRGAGGTVYRVSMYWRGAEAKKHDELEQEHWVTDTDNFTEYQTHIGLKCFVIVTILRTKEQDKAAHKLERETYNAK